MACILLLDDSDVAARAMQGLLARGQHTCVVALTTDDAWRILREGVVVDLLIVEGKLAKQDGVSFLQRVRDDWFWKNLPVVVYTNDSDPRQVRKAIALRVQNYLIKPYQEQHLYAEVAKALSNPWRNLLFEEPKSFCALLGLTPDTLATMRRRVMTAYKEAAEIFPLWAEERENTEVFMRLDALTAEAEGAGVWAGVDLIADLRAQGERDNWAAFKTAGEPFDYASRLIFCQLTPAHVPDCLIGEREREELREATEKARWTNLDVAQTGPIVAPEELEKQIAALAGCPVIDTVAAGFQMAADGRATSMTHVMELVSCDPGLCAQVLAAANQGELDEMTTIEDPKAAATLLGEIKLKAMAKALPIAHERHLAPALPWTNYWMYLAGVSRVSQFICNYLDFTYLSSNAATAGLLHDLGKLVLLKLHPFGFQAMLRYAAENKVPLREAERKHITWTSRELGVRFAEQTRLPTVFTDTIRWVEQPERATQNTDLVAMVSLARHVCLHNHVGTSGDLPGGACVPIAQTPAWQVLQPRLFPSFDLKKFEAQSHAYCVELRKELSGGAAATVRRSAAQRALAMTG